MDDVGGTREPTDLFDQWLAHRDGGPASASLPEGPEGPAAPAEETTPLSDDLSLEAASTAGTPETPVVADPDPEPEPVEPAEPGNHHAAAAAVLAALRADESEPEPVRAADPAPLDPTPAVRPDATPAPAPAPVRAGVRVLPRTIFFKPRGGTQRVLGVLLLGALALSAAAAWWAYQDRTYTSYAIVAVLVVVTGIIWATRTSASPARLTLHGSELEIVRNGSKALFDLAHTQVQMVGTPGKRGWKMLMLRRSMSPYVIDSSMVDPKEFTYVVRFFHPEI